MNNSLSRGQIVSVVIAGLVLEFTIFAWGVHAGYVAGQKQARIACVTEAIAKAQP